MSAYGKKGRWSGKSEKKESKEREFVPPWLSVFLPCLVSYLSLLVSRGVSVQFSLLVLCKCVPLWPCVLFLWVCFCRDCGPQGRKGPSCRCELGRQRENRAAHCTGCTGGARAAIWSSILPSQNHAVYCHCLTPQNTHSLTHSTFAWTSLSLLHPFIAHIIVLTLSHSWHSCADPKKSWQVYKIQCSPVLGKGYLIWLENRSFTFISDFRTFYGISLTTQQTVQSRLWHLKQVKWGYKHFFTPVCFHLYFNVKLSLIHFPSIHFLLQGAAGSFCF